jgi:hypothetical protein
MRCSWCKKVLQLLRPAHWAPDTAHCMICRSLFTPNNDRHHCRQCGKCICDSCIPEAATKINLKWCFQCFGTTDADREEKHLDANHTVQASTDAEATMEEQDVKDDHGYNYEDGVAYEVPCKDNYAVEDQVESEYIEKELLGEPLNEPEQVTVESEADD